MPQNHPNFEPPQDPQIHLELFSRILGTDDALEPAKPGEGSIEGTWDKFGKPKDPKKSRGLARERDTAFIMKELGFDVILRPKITPEDGLADSKDPDYRIRGKIYDNYAPETGNVRSMWSYILESKIEKKQTKRIILNLTDSPATVEEVMKQFKNYPMKGLLDLIIIK